MNITLTLDASPGLISVLQLLGCALSGIQSRKTEPSEPVQTGIESVQQQKAAPVKEEAESAMDKESEPASESPEQAYVVIKPEELRAVAATKDKTKIRALLDKWGSKSLSLVPEADRPAFLVELRGL